MPKRGLSVIVTTLILVLLAIVAVAIIWAVVGNLVEEESKDIKLRNTYFEQDMNIKLIKISETDPYLVNISLKNERGESISNITETPEPIIIPNDIISVVDVSGSMRQCGDLPVPREPGCTCEDITGLIGSSDALDYCYGLPATETTTCENCEGTVDDRIGAAKMANTNLVDILLSGLNSQNNIGFVVYSGNVLSLWSQNLTNITGDLKDKIGLWDIQGATCICCGIKNATEQFLVNSTFEKRKVMIIMSDGDASSSISCYPDPNPELTLNGADSAVKAAEDAIIELNNLTIYSIGLGENLNSDTLTRVANAGGGEYYLASDVNELIKIYENLGQQINEDSISVFDFAHIKFRIYDESGDFHDFQITDPPDILETRVYNFSVQGYLTPPIVKVEIYPVFVSPLGEQTIGPLFDSWNINE